MNNAENMFNTHETRPQELETHRGKVESMSSELLGAFLHEFCTYIQDYLPSTYLTSHTLNAATHFRLYVLEEASELSNIATKLRHESL